MKTTPFYDKPTMNEFEAPVKELGKIPATVFHTWSVLNILSGDNNFCCLSIHTLGNALGLSTSQAHERLQQVLTFKYKDCRIVQLAVAIPEKIDNNTGSIIYKIGKEVNVFEDGSYDIPKDKNGNIKPLGFKVNSITEITSS